MPDQPDPFEIFGLGEEPPPSDPRSGASRRASDDHAVRRPPEGAGSTDDAGYAVDGGYAESVHADDLGRRPAADPTFDDQYVDVPGGSAGSGGGRRWGLVLLGLLAVVVVVVGAGALWVRGQIDPGNPGDEVAFTIPAGSTTSEVAGLLADKSIITNATVFEWYLRVNGGGAFQAGDYVGLRTNSAMGDVVDVLEQGPVPPQPVTLLVREGLWESETRQLILDTFPRISPEALDAALLGTHPSLQPQGSDDLEGFLFPATYEIPEEEVGNAQYVVDQMVGAFELVSTETGLPDATTTLSGQVDGVTLTPYETLIVASLIEAEAKVPEDRAMIARVIYNRLEQGMTLGIDASVLYGLGERSPDLTQSDLDEDTPYNTRLNRGLPPTPINSPGRASIEAALAPAVGDWTFYVLYEEDGSHYFTDDYDDFLRAADDARDRGVF